MNRYLKLGSLILVLLLTRDLYPQKASALVIPLELEEVVLESNLIVHARVTAIEASWNQQHTLIYTTVTLEPIEHLKNTSNQISDTVTFRMLGGTVGNTTSRVYDNPRFHVGEEVLVCLKTEGYHWPMLMGAYQGKYSLSHAPPSGSGLSRLSKTSQALLERVRRIVKEQTP